MAARYPTLYQINTRVWLNELSSWIGHPATLDDVAEEELDRLAAQGFNWIWLLGVWQTGVASRLVSQTHPEWQAEFRAVLPDLTPEDIAGSCFAITDYSVHTLLGGNDALARFRQKLHERGLQLMVDFVPNHMALDHPWIATHPEYFVQGCEADVARAPQNFTRLATHTGPGIFAHGRDPYSGAWVDTVQLDYSNPELQAAMRGELARAAELADGVRCDMAMLVLPEVFQRTWGRQGEPFWPRAVREVRADQPGFLFLAEVYWDLEWTLMQQGFDYAYDKRLYDRLRAGAARPVREHFWAEPGYQDSLCRFLENHDEPRAATLAFDTHRAAAVLTFLSMGLRFFHQGQFEGRKVKISPHLVRGPAEPVDQELAQFYGALLAILKRPAVREGEWRLLESASAWQGNPTADDIIGFWWQASGERILVAVNYSPHWSQGYVRLPLGELAGRAWELSDLLGTERYQREGDELLARGLYLDVAPWTAHVFQVQ